MTLLQATVLAMLSIAIPKVAADDTASLPDGRAALNRAPVNTWVSIARSATGWRDQPVFVHAENIDRIIMASGYQAYSGLAPRHYDTEEFDPAALRWLNAYPSDLAEGRPESGPVGEEYTRQRAQHGHYGGEGIFYTDGDHLRLGAGGQWLETRAYQEYCYVPANGKVYAYLHDQTLRYDPVQRTWKDLEAEPRTSGRVWGSMCYDPVNHEIVHMGGDGGSEEIGTWVYAIEENEWRQLDFGSPGFKELHTQAKSLRWQAKALLGAVSNRFAVSETSEEEQADLVARATELGRAAGRLRAAIEAAELKEVERPAAREGLRRLDAAVSGLRELVAPADNTRSAMAATISPETIARVRAIRVQFEQVVSALASEPTGRARSQAAYDARHRQIVLFGGDELDRVLSDTWVYDCATRTWQQKFPEVCPRPRAGHVLAWLPKAERIVLAGGYSRVPLEQELWTYDVAANEWQLLLQLPGAEGSGGEPSTPDSPRADPRGVQVGAVVEDDVLISIGRDNGGLVTFACKVDPSQPIEIPEGASANSGDYAFHRINPADWENVAEPDAAKTRTFYDELPANQWTTLEFPKYAPGAMNRWGTTAYDPERHQFLFWGGGHATSQENDVAHYSVRGNVWTIGYHPDEPIERVYATQPTPVSFNDRPHVPIHAYKAYCYDPTAHRMFYFDRAYDPAVREWQPGVYPGLEHRGPMDSHMTPTPAGAVTYSSLGLFRFDAEAGQWVQLPWNGPDPNGIWCDGDSLIYDSKRDCLWLARQNDIYRYDMATGDVTKSTPDKPRELGEYLFWGEEVYLPEADLILPMKLFQKPDGKFGNVAWSPADEKFYWVDLKFVENGEGISFENSPFSWSDALQYDPKLDLILLNNSSARKIWALKFDHRTANLTEMEGAAAAQDEGL